MKRSFMQDFCVHVERVKSSKALHGSAHCQECLACASLPVGTAGKTNHFTFSPARINTPSTGSSSEAKGNWASFCYKYSRAVVRARILLVPQVSGPALGSYKLAVLGMPAEGRAREAQKLYCAFLNTRYGWISSEVFADVQKPFFKGHFNSSVN